MMAMIAAMTITSAQITLFIEPKLQLQLLFGLGDIAGEFTEGYMIPSEIGRGPYANSNKSRNAEKEQADTVQWASDPHGVAPFV